MRILTVTWGAYFLARALVRLAAFETLSTDAYVLVVALSDVPFLIALLAWSVAFTARRFRFLYRGRVELPGRAYPYPPE